MRCKAALLLLQHLVRRRSDALRAALVSSAAGLAFYVSQRSATACVASLCPVKSWPPTQPATYAPALSLGQAGRITAARALRPACRALIAFRNRELHPKIAEPGPRAALIQSQPKTRRALHSSRRSPVIVADHCPRRASTRARACGEITVGAKDPLGAKIAPRSQIARRSSPSGRRAAK